MTDSTKPPPSVSWFAVWKLPFLSNRLARISLLVVVCSFAALITYFSAYLAIVDEGLGATIQFETFIIGPSPHYSCHNTLPPRWSNFLKKFFRPAHSADKLMRPAKWAQISHEITPAEKKNGEIQIQLKPEWKKYLPPNQESLSITVPLPGP